MNDLIVHARNEPGSFTTAMKNLAVVILSEQGHEVRVSDLYAQRFNPVASAADYGTHTLHRTKASLIYRRTKNLRAVQLLLGHTKLESTVRYLGIEVDDALEMAEQTEV